MTVSKSLNVFCVSRYHSTRRKESEVIATYSPTQRVMSAVRLYLCPVWGLSQTRRFFINYNLLPCHVMSIAMVKYYNNFPLWDTFFYLILLGPIGPRTRLHNLHRCDQQDAFRAHMGSHVLPDAHHSRHWHRVWNAGGGCYPSDRFKTFPETQEGTSFRYRIETVSVVCIKQGIIQYSEII